MKRNSGTWLPLKQATEPDILPNNRSHPDAPFPFRCVFNIRIFSRRYLVCRPRTMSPFFRRFIPFRHTGPTLPRSMTPAPWFFDGAALSLSKGCEAATRRSNFGDLFPGQNIRVSAAKEKYGPKRHFNSFRQVSYRLVISDTLQKSGGSSR